jgi:hypothetical protein
MNCNNLILMKHLYALATTWSSEGKANTTTEILYMFDKHIMDRALV